MSAPDQAGVPLLTAEMAEGLLNKYRCNIILKNDEVAAIRAIADGRAAVSRAEAVPPDHSKEVEAATLERALHLADQPHASWAVRRLAAEVRRLSQPAPASARYVQPTIAELDGAIARGWCAPKTADRVMDPDLVVAIREEVLSLIRSTGLYAASRASAPAATCTCGFGGMHDDANPLCALYATPAGSRPEDAGLVDVEAVSWAYRKLLAFGVGSIKAEDAHMLDRLNLMLQEPPK